MVNSKSWEIIHIPGKAPFLPTQQPTVNVFASVIDPQLANTLVRKLNNIAPLQDFRHVKRVRKTCSDGKNQLSVILCISGENGTSTELGCIPADLLELINSHQLSPFVTQVCKYAATTKEEWEEQCKLWPTSFHPPTYNIDGITGFSQEDSEVVFSHMNFALKLAKSANSQVNSAVIVDPSVNQIITSACDEITSWNMHLVEKEAYSEDTDEASTVNGASNGSSPIKFNLNGSPCDPNTSCSKVSCLNPWQWSQLNMPSSNSCFLHPLRHAAMVAIEYSASRDRRLYPAIGEADDKYFELDSNFTSTKGLPAKRQKTTLDNVKNSGDAPANSKFERPYLCTGYDIYLAWEPCAMCAMALVHQRFRRIFYAFPNPYTGALGSVYRLQGEKSLNHHYAVFRVILNDEVLGGPEDLTTVNKDN